MHPREALEQIAEIRLRMAQSEHFRGYRALPAAISGVLALLAGLIQPQILRDPVAEIDRYAIFWILVASVSVGLVLATIGIRHWLAGKSDCRTMTWLALWQFVPCIIGGFILTVVIVRDCPEAGWLLPGIWQLFFSQGVFASCRLLPRAAYSVAIFYLVTGLLCLLFARHEWAFSPLVMAIPFGVGQMVAAAVLYWTLERHEQG